ncbi:MAG: response regulator transcription factor [Thermaerobacter sp.]|nr:response regulator transcription factor [Thermaerobacter sp.]
MRVLIVEDHAEVWQWLATELSHRGWQVQWARTAEMARTEVRHGTYHAILLDIMLPDGDGLQLCRELRTITRVPILMVTARHEVHDRVQALEDGADDYLTKPFAIEELVARVRAVRRRAAAEPGPLLEVGDIRMLVEERVVEIHGQPVRLSRREFDLLRVLLENPYRVLSREQLLEQAWGFDFYGESNVVDVTIRRLRDHLPGTTLGIVSVRGVGYVLREMGNEG